MRLSVKWLACCFFRGLALNASQWVQLSLTFLPIFLCTGILLSMGILLIRIYHDEVKKKEVIYWNIIRRSWEVVIGSSSFAISIILSYLLLWMLLGIFVLLREVPAVGEFFLVILSFAPFIINLGTLVLCVLSLGLLFIGAPLIAFKGLDKGSIFQMAIKRLDKNPFANIILMMVSLIPLVLILLLLMVAANLTGNICIECQSALQTILKMVFYDGPVYSIFNSGCCFFL